MSENKKSKTEIDRLNFEGKVTDLARTRKQQTSTPIKNNPVDIKDISLGESSSEFFQSVSSENTTVVPLEESILDISKKLVDLSIDLVFEKVKINENKMALTLDKMMAVLPTFNGNFKDLTSFIRVAELIFDKIPAADTTSEPVFLQVVLSKLTGDAQFLYKNGSSFATWALLKVELKKQFTKKLRTIDVERTLGQITHKNNESVHDFSLRLKEIWYLLCETLSDITDTTILDHYKKDFEIKIIDTFKNSLREPLRSWLKAKTFLSFLDAVEFAEKEENMAYMTIPKVLGNEINNHGVDNITRQMGNVSINRNSRCHICDRRGHLAPQCWQREPQWNQEPMYRRQNFNNGFNPNFNRNNMPMQNGQPNQSSFNNNSTQNSKNYVGGQANNIRRIRTVLNEDSDIPIYYTQ